MYGLASNGSLKSFHVSLPGGKSRITQTILIHQLHRQVRQACRRDTPTAGTMAVMTHGSALLHRSEKRGLWGTFEPECVIFACTRSLYNHRWERHGSCGPSTVSSQCSRPSETSFQIQSRCQMNTCCVHRLKIFNLYF